jgi:hypothetical protein
VGRSLPPRPRRRCGRGAALLALIAGQDPAAGVDGTFGIVRGVAKDRTISTVDPRPATAKRVRTAASTATRPQSVGRPRLRAHRRRHRRPGQHRRPERPWRTCWPNPAPTPRSPSPRWWAAPPMPTGGGQGPAGPQRHRRLHQGPLRHRPRGLDRDLPGGPHRGHHLRCPGRVAGFASHFGTCPLRADCTGSAKGRSITIHLHEAALQRAKAAQRTKSGRPATGPTAPSSSARSPTPPAGPGAGARPHPRVGTGQADVATRAGRPQLGSPRRAGPAFDLDGLGHRLNVPGGDVNGPSPMTRTMSHQRTDVGSPCSHTPTPRQRVGLSGGRPFATRPTRSLDSTVLDREGGRLGAVHGQPAGRFDGRAEVGVGDGPDLAGRPGAVAGPRRRTRVRLQARSSDGHL